jgi:hypothetical protein
MRGKGGIKDGEVGVGGRRGEEEDQEEEEEEEEEGREGRTAFKRQAFRKVSGGKRFGEK